MAMASQAQASGEGIHAASRPAGKHASRALRAAGGVPAVVYGHGAPSAVALSAKDAHAIAQMPRNRVFVLHIDGDEEENVRLVDLQREATTGRVVHLDLERVVRGERSRATVAVHIVGEEELARREGVVTRLVEELEIEGETMHLPAAVAIDVASLGSGAHVLAGEVALPPGVTLVTPADTPVLQIGHAQAVAEAAPAPAEGTSAQAGTAASEPGAV
jgi:large subunit ribosomal protein L25